MKEKTNLELLRELAEPYGIKVYEVPQGKGGLIWNGKKLTPEEAMELLFSAFQKAKI